MSVVVERQWSDYRAIEDGRKRAKFGYHDTEEYQRLAQLPGEDEFDLALAAHLEAKRPLIEQAVRANSEYFLQEQIDQRLRAIAVSARFFRHGLGTTETEPLFKKGKRR